MEDPEDSSQLTYQGLPSILGPTKYVYGAHVATTVGERGQVTIEKAIREELGVYAGDVAVQRVEGRRVIIEFVPAPHSRSLAGVLRDRARPVMKDQDWEAVRDYAEATPDPDREG